MTQHLTFIIVTWNSTDTIVRCLDSVFAEAPRAEVIVIDNNSRDSTADYVEDHYPLARVIRNNRNDGFGRACNMGAALANGEFLFFLNPDAMMEPGCMTRLLDVMRKSTDTAIAGPVLRARNGRITSAGPRFLTPGRFLLSRVLGAQLVRVPSAASPVDWVSGAALLIRRNCFKELGGFDRRFWMYVEDMHLCWKAKKRGWHVIVVPDAVVSHDRGMSARNNGEQVLRSNAASTLVWFAEIGTRHHSLIGRPLIFASLIVIGTKQCLLRRSIRLLMMYLNIGWMVLKAPASLTRR